jgi:uncharacterized protein Yka (UPF0111/DUF47 family)
MCDVSKQMEALERSGDEVIHEIFRRLQSTFITPFDPEDIQTPATALDNVLDSIEDATFRIVAYRLDPIPPGAVELGRMIADSCRALDRALSLLHVESPFGTIASKLTGLRTKPTLSSAPWWGNYSAPTWTLLR